MLRDSAYPSRRMLLAGLGAGVVGVAATAAPVLSLRFAPSPSGQPASWWDRTFLSLQSAGLAEWKGLVGQTFSLDSLSGSSLLKVVAVTAFPASGRRPQTLARSQAFSVVFESVSGPPLAPSDRVAQLAHRSYPSLPIYLSAPTRAGQKIRVAAVFN